MEEVKQPTPEKMMYYETVAFSKFPDMTPELALARYAKTAGAEGLFFKDSHGDRCVWAKPIRDSSKEAAKQRYRKKYLAYESRWKFMPLKQPLTCAQVDEPRTFKYWRAVGHSSESGWNLPENVKNNRHLLNLPSELLYRILEYVLIAPKGISIYPHTITSNSINRSIFNSYTSSYSIRERPENSDIDTDTNIIPGTISRSSPLYTWTEKRDRDGKYFEMRKTYRPIIDAGILRVSKDLYKRGSQMFFTQNKLSFWMANGSLMYSPPTLLPHGNIVHRPKTRLPWNYQRPERIAHGLVQIQHQWPLPMLEGFLYYDPFLRYLHTIGPVHASKLKHLKFEGVIRLHQCEEGYCGEDVCLMQALYVYVNFIAKFCTAVEKVEVHTVLDTHFPETQGEFLHPWGPDTIQATLKYVLDCYVQKIPSLKEFVAFDSFGNKVLDWSLENDGLGQFIEDAIEGTAWERDEVAVVEENGLGCGFCGEDHETRECFNLCGFCGRFGHWKKSCAEYWECWKSEWEEEKLTDQWLRSYPYTDRWQWMGRCF